jgi:hypothetical protein
MQMTRYEEARSHSSSHSSERRKGMQMQRAYSHAGSVIPHWGRTPSPPAGRRGLLGQRIAVSGPDSKSDVHVRSQTRVEESSHYSSRESSTTVRIREGSNVNVRIGSMKIHERSDGCDHCDGNCGAYYPYCGQGG